MRTHTMFATIAAFGFLAILVIVKTQAPTDNMRHVAAFLLGVTVTSLFAVVATHPSEREP